MHVAVARRLDHGGELRPASALATDEQVAAVDDLVAQEALVGLGQAQAHELALARLERQRDAGALGQRAVHGPAASTTAPRGDHARRRAARRDARRRRRAIAATVVPVRTRRPGARRARQRAGDRPRVALEVAREVERRAAGRSARGSARARVGGVDEARVDARRRAGARPARARRPRSRASGWTISAPLRRIRATGAEQRLELVVDRQAERPSGRARARRPCRSTGRCPRPARSCRPRPRRGRASVDRYASARELPGGRRRRRCRRRPRRRRARLIRRSRPGTGRRVEQVLAHAGDPGAAGDLGHDRRQRPPTVGLLDERPVKRVPITDSLTNGLADARARRGRAAAPGAPRCRSRTASGRASRGGSRSRARVGAVAAGRVEHDVVAAARSAGPRDAPAGRRRRSRP